MEYKICINWGEIIFSKNTTTTILPTIKEFHNVDYFGKHDGLKLKLWWKLKTLRIHTIHYLQLLQNFQVSYPGLASSFDE